MWTISAGRLLLKLTTLDDLPARIYMDDVVSYTGKYDSILRKVWTEFILSNGATLDIKENVEEIDEIIESLDYK